MFQLRYADQPEIFDQFRESLHSYKRGIDNPDDSLVSGFLLN